MMRHQRLLATIVVTLLGGLAHAQEVTTATVPGVTNFARLEATIACGGATTTEGVAELKKPGYASIINLRLATETGADIEAAKAAANVAGVRYIHLPLNGQSPVRPSPTPS